MAKHARIKNKGNMMKTYSFKVRDTNLTMDALAQYNEYYNRFSEWICRNLVIMTIGELASHVPEKKRKANYYLSAVDGKWSGEPMYKLFTDEYSKRDGFTNPEVVNSNNCDNLLLASGDSLNPEGYDGNIMGLSKTTYCTFGYKQQAISNIKTKITTMKPKVRRKVLPESSSYEDKMEQVLYEKHKNGLFDATAFRDKLEYLKRKENPDPNLISRMEKLYVFFKENRNEIVKREQDMAVGELVSFTGCKRDIGMASMTIRSQCMSVSRKEGCQGYTLEIPVGKEGYLSFDLYGRRDVIKDGIELVDVCNRHANTVTIKVVDGEMYVDIAVATDFTKKSKECTKSIGIDVNTKHMLMQTSAKDTGSFEHYVNLYKAFAEDEELNDILGEDEIIQNIRKNSENVSFAPIETDLLYSRILGGSQKHKLAEDRVTRILKELSMKFQDAGMVRERIYVQCVCKLRGNLKHLVYLQNKYYEAQQEYDRKMGFEDEPSVSGNGMGKRRQDSPFRSTDEAYKLYGEINACQKRIVAIRNGIVDYAYSVLECNGYDNVSLEYLTSSQFKVSKTFPSVNSLLKYHRLEGKTAEESEKCEAYARHKSKYEVFFKNGVIESIGYSSEGIRQLKRERAGNIIIKAIHFAEVKDRFVLLSNNGKMSVTLVPSYHTSQIDSTDHKMFITSDGKILDKRKVRRIQEMHVNGLNADFNSARNIEYIAVNDEWRGTLCKRTKNEYCEPLYAPVVKSQSGMLKAIKKLGATKVWKE